MLDAELAEIAHTERSEQPDLFAIAERSGPRAAPSPAAARHDGRAEASPGFETKDLRPAPVREQTRGERRAPDAPATRRMRRPPGFLRRRPVAALAGSAGLALAVAAGHLWWENAEHFESTDDAFIASRQIPIAPRISGDVVAVPVTDNQHVAAGDVIAGIDDRDYRVALDQANAQVSSAKAGIASVDAQAAVQRAQIEASQAQVDQAEAALKFAREQAARYEELVQRGAGAVQNAQQYSSQLAQQQAAVKSAEAALSVAERQIEALKAQRETAMAALAQANAQRAQALLNLSYTTLRAAEPGRIVALSAEPGEFVQPGTNLTMFVPDDIWITANFKETQLDEMLPSQPVTVTLDAYPDRPLRGHVASIQPGSGTAFSLLPAENATGNYVKVVQRVPVKIVLDDVPSGVALGPGMSVEPTVRVDPRPSLYEQLTAAMLRLWRKS